MAMNLTQKMINDHLIEGDMSPGNEIALRVDQTLTQDATGTMACLQFEAIGIPRVRTELSVSYIDHNITQAGFENADDHQYLQTVAAKYGIVCSKAGNGICHQVHVERFGIPGKSLLGADSHTPTCGGIGMLAIGAGGLDVAMAMAGRAFYLKMPRVIHVRLTGKLRPGVTAKDIILELLRRFSVKGGVGKAFEYGGDGILQLTVPERASITNMGAELGATTSIFPSDDQTRTFLKAQGREADYRQLAADADALYDETIEIDLSTLEPLVAKPHMPDNVVPLRDLEGQKVDQIFIGSCTNSSWLDLMRVAEILKGKRVHPDVSLAIACGSRQVLSMLSSNGALSDLLAAGARLLECGCGPCTGRNFSPKSGGVSMRTINRNFAGRCGTADGQVYLASAESCAASALSGTFSDACDVAAELTCDMPERFEVDDGLLLFPPDNGLAVEVLKGPNIKTIPSFPSLADDIHTQVVIKVGDNITTGHIMPSLGITQYRSNLPKISQYLFSDMDPSFAKRVRGQGGGVIVAGENYGQGSSREHAALGVRYLGVQAVIARSFARIHRENLINFGILPLILENPDDLIKLEQDEELKITDVMKGIDDNLITVNNLTQGCKIRTRLDLTERQCEVLKAGGLLNSVKK